MGQGAAAEGGLSDDAADYVTVPAVGFQRAAGLPDGGTGPFRLPSGELVARECARNECKVRRKMRQDRSIPVAAVQ